MSDFDDAVSEIRHIERVCDYGDPPQFETLAEADAAVRTLNYCAQLIGFGLNPQYIWQRVFARVNEQRLRFADEGRDGAS